MAEMTTADMLALSSNKDSFLEGNGLIVLILFLLMWGWGGNGFGGSNAVQGALTRAEMADGFNISEIQRNQSDIKAAICNTDQMVMQNRYDAALGNAALAQQIAENKYAAALQAQNMQAQMAQCCCDIKTAITADGAATRAMIQQQTIDDLKSQLNTATNAIANATQTQNILNTLGRFVSNPPVNPCGCYNTGC